MKILKIVNKILKMRNNLRSILLIFGIVFSYGSVCQNVYTVKEDSTILWYSNYDLKVHKDLCTNGTRILLDDSTKEILIMSEVKNCKLHGSYKRFFKNGMPKEFGYYDRGKKNGYFYFWNKYGHLIRKEHWKDNKLISKKV